jgi:hypothetical protein
MPIFKVTGTIKVEVATLVEAADWEEAEKLVADRETTICIHGSEFTDGLDPESDQFVLVDGCTLNFPEDLDAEEWDEQ